MPSLGLRKPGCSLRGPKGGGGDEGGDVGRGWVWDTGREGELTEGESNAGLGSQGGEGGWGYSCKLLPQRPPSQ